MKYKDIQLHMKDAVLTPDEKAALRFILLNRIQTVSPQTSVFDYLRFAKSLRIATVGFASVVFLGAGISYAAERALPGDVLYPVKVEVTERMRTWVAVSQEAQAEWSVVRTTRRLEELEQLMKIGGLNKKISDEIASRLEENTDEAKRNITHLKTARIEVAADTSSRLESSLRVHERVLVQVAEERADMASQIHVILDIVREKTKSVSEIRQAIEKERGQIEGDMSLNEKSIDVLEKIEEVSPEGQTQTEQKSENATTTLP